MELIGLVLLVIGMFVSYCARQGEGTSGAFLFLLGLALLAMGIYLMFFEDGTGLARWFPALRI